MITARSKAVFPLILPAIALCACAEPAPREPQGETARGPTFSEADKRAAQALSLGTDTSQTTPSGSEYERALICLVSIDSIVERVGTNALTADQRTSFQQIQSLYRRRLEAQGAAEGKTPREIRTDLAELAETTEPGDAGRAAIGCLRQLEREQA